MGLAASQARLLFLTARLSDLELRAQVISNSKIRLADESKNASDEYCRALDKKQFRVATGADKNGPTYDPASVSNLTAYNENVSHQRLIKDGSGRLIVSDATALNFQNATHAWDAVPGMKYGNVTPDQYKNMPLAQLKNDPTFVEFVSNMEGRTDQTGDGNYGWEDYVALIAKLGDPKMEYYQKMFLEMNSGGYKAISNDDAKSPEWLEMQVNQGNIYLFTEQRQSDGKMAFENVSWESGDSSIQEVEDSKDTARAEAKYNRTMADIQSKDKRFDLQLKNIDTEHQATQTTIDSVKKVIEKDIDRNLKMFQA